MATFHEFDLIGERCEKNDDFQNRNNILSYFENFIFSEPNCETLNNDNIFRKETRRSHVQYRESGSERVRIEFSK